MSEVVCTQLCSQTLKGVRSITTTEFDISIEPCVSINNKVVSNRCSTTLTTNGDQRCVSSKVQCLCLCGEEVDNTCFRSQCDSLSRISCVTTNGLISTDQNVTSNTELLGSDQGVRVRGVVVICTTNLDLGDLICTVINVTKEDVRVIRCITQSEELIASSDVTNVDVLYITSKIECASKCAVRYKVECASCLRRSDLSSRTVITIDFDVMLKASIISKSRCAINNQCSIELRVVNVNTNTTTVCSSNSQNCLIIRSSTVTTNQQSIVFCCLITISEVSMIQEVSSCSTTDECSTNNIEVCTRICACCFYPCIFQCRVWRTSNSVNTKFKVTNCIGFSSQCFSTNDTNFLPYRVRELNRWILCSSCTTENICPRLNLSRNRINNLYVNVVIVGREWITRWRYNVPSTIQVSVWIVIRNSDLRCISDTKCRVENTNATCLPFNLKDVRSIRCNLKDAWTSNFSITISIDPSEGSRQIDLLTLDQNVTRSWDYTSVINVLICLQSCTTRRIQWRLVRCDVRTKITNSMCEELVSSCSWISDRSCLLYTSPSPRD